MEWQSSSFRGRTAPGRHPPGDGIRQAALGGTAFRHIRWDSSAVEACGQVLDSKEAKNRTSDRLRGELFMSSPLSLSSHIVLVVQCVVLFFASFSSMTCCRSFQCGRIPPDMPGRPAQSRLPDASPGGCPPSACAVGGCNVSCESAIPVHHSWKQYKYGYSLNCPPPRSDISGVQGGVSGFSGQGWAGG